MRITPENAVAWIWCAAAIALILLATDAATWLFIGPVLTAGVAIAMLAGKHDD